MAAKTRKSIYKEEEKQLLAALEAKWDYIKYDMVEISGGNMSADDIQNCVPDYLEGENFRLFMSFTPKIQKDLLCKAFPYGACL